ncbi:AMP-binding protein [Actinophytocola sp. NPDC049390]|uniref:AMP-binding protein n=1 Tax=Actinophytocola sp. NPDC049390 TaxID=3363894 RepID=UPI0037B5271A
MTVSSERVGWPAGLDAPVPAGYAIAHAACDRWADDPARRALLDLSGGEPRWWTFADVRDASSRLANALAAQGVRFGDRVAIALPQSADAALAHLAVYRLGAIAVPISLMHREEAIAQRLSDSGATVAITSAEHWAAVVEHSAVADGVTWLRTGTPEFTAMTTSGSTTTPGAPVGAETPAVIVYTSGTTGAPKGVVHAHRVVAAHAAPISLAHDGFPREHDLLWSPADWAWAGGLIDCLLSAWHAGVPIVAHRARKFDPDEVLDLIARHGIRNAFLPATALRLLRRSDRRATLRSIMTGGEPVDEDVVAWATEELGATPNVVFGQTEASCVVGNSHAVLPQRPGALGVAYPGAEVAVLDPGGSAECAPDELGEIAVRADSPAVMLGYWQREADTEAKIVDGWLRTGDLGRRDADGYFWFTARADDLIISSGYRIGPVEIESCLQADPRVAEVAVVGRADAERGQVVCALVVPHDGVARTDVLADELRARVRGRLATYEVPRVVEFLDALPRTTTGKVQRSAIRRAGE